MKMPENRRPYQRTHNTIPESTCLPAVHGAFGFRAQHCASISCPESASADFARILHSWHKGKARAFIDAHEQLDMLCFPPGCSDLNPRQHIWKQTRDAVGHLWGYRHIGGFRQAFQVHLENTFFHFDWIAK
jgi:hypothetical protein